MICPKCKKEGKREAGFSTPISIPPFYKDGKYHSGNIEVEKHECSNGHRWWEIVPKNWIYVGGKVMEIGWAGKAKNIKNGYIVGDTKEE